MTSSNGYHNLLLEIYETETKIICKPNNINSQNAMNKELAELDVNELCATLDEQLEKYKKYLYLTVKRFVEMKKVYYGVENAMKKSDITVKQIDEIIIELIKQKYDIFLYSGFVKEPYNNLLNKEIEQHKHIMDKIISVYEKIVLSEEEKESYISNKSKKQFIMKETINVGKTYELVTNSNDSSTESVNIFDKILNKFRK